MQNPTNKTDQSVKTGLEIESHPVVQTEKDADEMVHENTDESFNETEENDLDELVHSQTKSEDKTNAGEKDPDDLVHKK